MLLTGDLGYRFLEPFAEKYPGRFINIGVAEANLVTVAAGLAATGFKPFIYSIATFASMRAFEQVRNDIMLQKMNVKIVGIGAGLAYTKAGPTHHSMEDIALMRTLPGMVIVSPADTNQAYAATRKLADYTGPAYLRLERNPAEPVYRKPPVFRIGKGILLESGRRVALLATGTKIGLVRQTAGLLAKKGIQPSIVNLPTVYPLDVRLLGSLTSGHRLFVTFEEHRVTGGIGTAIGEWLLTQNPMQMVRLVKIGLKDEYSDISAGYEILLAANGMTAGRIARRILAALNQE